MTAPKTIVPPIKCQGIKTKLVPWIRQAVPADFGGNGTWIEPFMGSGAVAFNMRPKRALLADSNPHVIRFYKAVADGEISPASARRFLEREGGALRRSDGGRYYEIRDRFNALGDPLDFLFLNRACFNGLIRFNRKGEFNVPFCRKPDRFAKPHVTKIVNQIRAVADILRAGDYRLECQDFSAAIATARDGDFIYCDPPYAGRHADYFSDWDAERESRLARELSAAPCRFLLSTWRGNRFRQNASIDGLWASFHILTREHFYHVGASEDNRNPMTEALVANYAIPESAARTPNGAASARQPTLIPPPAPADG